MTLCVSGIQKEKLIWSLNEKIMKTAITVIVQKKTVSWAIRDTYPAKTWPFRYATFCHRDLNNSKPVSASRACTPERHSNRKRIFPDLYRGLYYCNNLFQRKYLYCNRFISRKGVKCLAYPSVAEETKTRPKSLHRNNIGNHIPDQTSMTNHICGCQLLVPNVNC